MIDVNGKPQTKGYSIKLRIACAFFAIVVIQGLILVCSIIISGAIEKNNVATYNTLANQSNNRKNEIQKQFNTKRQNITIASVNFSSQIEKLLEDNGISIESLKDDESIFDAALEMSLAELVMFAKVNAVTGVFVIIDPSPDIVNEDVKSRTCMYIRNSSPGSIVADDKLQLEYGRVDISRRIGITADYLWTRDMDFSGGFSRDLYFKPIRAALESGEGIDVTKPHVYGYWSSPFILRNNDVALMTYSLPLLLHDGTPYGVMGFEIDTTEISNSMPAVEVPYEQGFYVLGKNMTDGFYSDGIVSSGPYAQHFLRGENSKIDYNFVYETNNGVVYEMTNSNYPGSKAIGAYSEISLYETYSPFYSEKWALISMAAKDSVMQGSRSVTQSVVISILSTTALAMILSIFAMFYIFGPIRGLYEKVRLIDPEKPVRFDRVGINEIDELSGAFEVLSDKISDAAAKMFRIIELVDMPLGSFEINYGDNRVQLSKSMLSLMHIQPRGDAPYIISVAEWSDVIGAFEEYSATTNDEGIKETLYIADSLGEARNWFRMRLISENSRDIGILMDVTEEIVQKQRLEFERNYDSLTKLLNQQTFYRRATELVENKYGTAGIMMFADLDDLKFVNDLYGHETGDAYIKEFASFLTKFKDLNAAIGRISGDEFVMFMNGFGSQEEAKAAFDNIFAGLKDTAIHVSDGAAHRVRVSVGIAYYPYDSSDMRELVRYADYAMYEIKRTNKGEVKEFNIGSYNKNSFVLHMKNALNVFIEEKRVHFAFQPIVDVRTGEIFAYESLMRSMMQELKSPDEILQVARSQAKLYQIEKLTFQVVLEWLDKNRDRVGDRKIFINSIPNQVFTDSDMTEICESHKHLFNQIVFEVTENEYSIKEETKKKMDAFREWGSLVAIDDYGSGYSNDLALLYIEPDFLKIDMSIVRNINKDVDKQQLVQNIIAYASKRNIKIIAEGVEDFDEMETLINFGVDYIQGYYLAKPNFEIIDLSEEAKHKMLDVSDRRMQEGKN